MQISMQEGKSTLSINGSAFRPRLTKLLTPSLLHIGLVLEIPPLYLEESLGATDAEAMALTITGEMLWLCHSTISMIRMLIISI